MTVFLMIMAWPLFELHHANSGLKVQIARYMYH
nr:MAG TPA: hypothetical protein [Caudoviricetes sp.]